MNHPSSLSSSSSSSSNQKNHQIKNLINLNQINQLKSSAWGNSLKNFNQINQDQDQNKINHLELDTKISQLIIQESKNKESLWKSIGISAYNLGNRSLSDQSSKTGPTVKTNKRFLKSVIRDVNDHNRTLIPSSSSSSSISRSRNIEQEEDDDKKRKRQEIRREDKYQDQDRYHSHSSKPHQVRDSDLERLILRAGGNRKSKGKGKETADEFDQCQNRLDESTHRSKNVDLIDEEKRSRYQSASSNHLHDRLVQHNHRTETGSDQETRSVDQTPSTSSLPISVPQRSTMSSSKMDKYFTSDYDPRFDINLDDLTNPKTKLINESNLDDWEQLLDQLKIKREEKLKQRENQIKLKLEKRERKLERRERRKRKKELKKRGRVDQEEEEEEEERRRRKKKRKTRSKNDEDQSSQDESKRRRDKKKKRKSSHTRKRDYSSSSSSSSSDDDDSTDQERYRTTHAQRTARKELGLMDIEGYAKAGKIREWDLGKQNPT